MCEFPSYQKYNKFAAAMNTWVQNDSNLHDIKRLKRIIDDQVAESVTLFKFEDYTEGLKKLVQKHKKTINKRKYRDGI